MVAVLASLATAFESQPKGTAAPPLLHGDAAWAPGSRRAPAFALRDQDGRMTSLADQRGRVVLLTFLDSRCDQDCPIEARQLAAVEHALGRVDGPVLLIVSVNPADRPDSVRAFMRKAGLAGGWTWHWLMGTEAQISEVWRSYLITVIVQKADIAHDTVLYLVDRSGYERAGYLMPLQVRDVTADARVLSERWGR